MSGIAGKTIFNIPNSSAVPFITAVDEAGEKVAEQYGASQPCEVPAILLRLRVAGLDDEAGDDPMEGDPVIEAAAGQGD